MIFRDAKEVLNTFRFNGTGVSPISFVSTWYQIFYRERLGEIVFIFLLIPKISDYVFYSIRNRLIFL